MPSPAPILPEQCMAQLQALGEQVRARRKALRLSATVTAEAAGLSRVTLHRIEKGEPAKAPVAKSKSSFAQRIFKSSKQDVEEKEQE